MSMSLFGSLMGTMDDDPFFGSALRQMHGNAMDSMSMMSSIFQDPFGMSGLLGGGFDRTHHGMGGLAAMNSFMRPFAMPLMPNFNRMCNSMEALNGPIGGNHPIGMGNYSSSSTVISMTSGPDGRPQVYKATSSTKVAPGGIKETQRTVTDSVTGTKKMAIGHHIGDRAHIIEKEKNMRTGDEEERQDFINIEEEEAGEFNHEWESKTRCVSEIPRITSSSSRNRHAYSGYSAIPAITAGSSSNRRNKDRITPPLVAPRRSIHSPKLALPSTSSTTLHANNSSQRTPYSASGYEKPRKSKNIKSVSGSHSSDKQQQQQA